MLRVHQLLKQHSGGVQINPWDLWTRFKMFIDSLKKSQTNRHEFKEETPLPVYWHGLRASNGEMSSRELVRLETKQKLESSC